MIAPPVAELLHRPLAALVRAYGAPTSVATRDDGQHVTFGDAAGSVVAIVDDDATIHAVDLTFPAGTRYAIDVQGKSHTLTFGTTGRMSWEGILRENAMLTVARPFGLVWSKDQIGWSPLGAVIVTRMREPARYTCPW